MSNRPPAADPERTGVPPVVLAAHQASVEVAELAAPECTRWAATHAPHWRCGRLAQLPPEMSWDDLPRPPARLESNALDDLNGVVLYQVDCSAMVDSEQMLTCSFQPSASYAVWQRLRGVAGRAVEGQPWLTPGVPPEVGYGVARLDDDLGFRVNVVRRLSPTSFVIVRTVVQP